LQLERGQATLPNLQIVVRQHLTFSQDFYRSGISLRNAW
jgi:hypothetical protein